ncbi:MAG: hypothetical protein FJ291_23415 [Planctomycetes bacterium]|nr:hypothetical protein [Planctomycetota bacterium]
MIEKLRVRNFRCLRDVEVPLGPLNFLVGPNNTGKSSFLDAIELLSRCMRVNSVGEAFQQLGLRLDRALAQPGESRSLEYSADVNWPATPESGERAHYDLAMRPNPAVPAGSNEAVLIEREVVDLGWDRLAAIASFRRTGASQPQSTVSYPDGKTENLPLYSYLSTIPHSMQRRGDGRLAPLAAALRSTPKYSLVPQRVAQPCQLQEGMELAADGYGLASCLYELSQRCPARFRMVEDALRLFVPSVEIVRFPPGGPGQTTIVFHEKGGAGVYASQASDGLLLFLAHLTIAYAHGDVGVVLVEEPETGVNPHRLRAIVELLRAISRGALGSPPVQVIATSHSPYLLDWCSKDEILIFQRDAGGDAQVTPLSKVEHIEEQLKDFTPGELIYTFGEQICGSRS